jgi:TPR repeat protein
MMAAMRGIYALLLAVLTSAWSLAARAQFYDLDGAYRCLTTPDAACEKELRDQPRQPPPPPPPSGPTMAQVIAKVRAKTADAKDMQLLEKKATADDPRAVEVLAWCKLNGIGGAADAAAAYWLYRQAAKLGVANARQNQIAVYESRLTPDERQRVLLRENAR